MNIVVASTALFVSFSALLISVQEVRILRMQQKATMYPYLTLGKTYNSRGFGIVLKNSGNGLARINSYQIFNDSIYFKDWEQVLKTLAPEAKNINFDVISTNGNIRNKMITPNEEVNIIFLQWTDETRRLERTMHSLQLRICYSSLLDEHWELRKETPITIDTRCTAESTKEFGT
ncbi:hypothetical protein FK220_011995 [Flavobacteriaceae bacterium TP-CH-4]|uniref:Uncharacterized protein n=1 Tax=Pelagihabitans pacificus TaxID=2696054 RepID=A0A967AU59_9FLAO|nr:hypothetical protein [Pelagihabitans pacificus]NHF60069.1 hypothetical protein [Pelagihabitans pacificus]